MCLFSYHSKKYDSNGQNDEINNRNDSRVTLKLYLKKLRRKHSFIKVVSGGKKKSII